MFLYYMHLKKHKQQQQQDKPFNLIYMYIF